MPSSLLAHSALRDNWPPFFTEMGTVVYFLMFFSSVAPEILADLVTADHFESI